MIDFNCVSTYQESFYAKRLGICVYYSFVSNFYVVSEEFFAHTHMISNNPIEYKNLHTIVWFQVFVSNTNNYILLSNYFYSIMAICWHVLI